MKVVLFVTRDEGKRKLLKSCFPGDHLFIESNGDNNSWTVLNDLVKGIVLVDIDCPEAETWLKQAIKVKPGLVYIGVGQFREHAKSLSKYLYDCIFAPYDQWEMEKTLERAWEKIALLDSNEQGNNVNEESFIAKHAEAVGKPGQLAEGYPSRPWAKVLSDFSRALNNRLDRDRFLDLFLDAVKELVPVGKIAVLLRSQTGEDYFIAAQRGLNPALQRKTQFKATEGIISWLSANDRILHLNEADHSEKNHFPGGLLQEMKMLHAVVAIPFMAHGKLNGALCLGEKITGSRFYEKEIELLYTICGNIAIALDDIGLHEQLYNQKIYIESILHLMNSGVIAIDNNHLITTFNKRAGDIFKESPEDLIGRDLRNLPSPFGDLLYETLISGRKYNKEEYIFNREKIPLEVSTYRMVNEANQILGSVMIVDDITARKQVENERHQAEQLEVLNSFVSQLAHEIKNPMVTIKTFTQMLPEKYEDSSFRNNFYYTVKQEVKRLNEIIDQLIAYSSPLMYKYEIIGLHDLIDSAFELLNEQGQGTNIKISKEYSKKRAKVKADRVSMSRAISYLLKYLLEASGNEGDINIKTYVKEEKNGDMVAKILLSDTKTKVKQEELNELFSPLSIKPDKSVSLGLPVSKKTVEEHGGELKAVQPEGDTVKFGIVIPAYTAESDSKKGELINGK